MALVFHDFLETEGFVHPPPKVRRRLRFGRLSGSSCLQRYTRRPPRNLEVLPPIRLLVDPSCFSWRWPRDSSVLHFSCETGYPVQHMSPFFKILAKARSAGTHESTTARFRSKSFRIHSIVSHRVRASPKLLVARMNCR